MGKMDVRMQRRGSSDAARPDMHRSRCLKLAVFTSASDQYPIFCADHLWQFQYTVHSYICQGEKQAIEKTGSEPRCRSFPILQFKRNRLPITH